VSPIVRVTREDERYHHVLFDRFDSTAPPETGKGNQIETRSEP